LALRHLDDPNTEDRESLSAELLLLEIQLALNLKVRDSTFEAEITRSRTQGEVTPQVKELVRSLVNGTFGKEIDRLQSQLTSCREKLAASR
jgi:hypothetical protein